VPSCISFASVRLHASNPNLSTAVLGNDKVDPESLDSHFDVAKLQEDFCRVATDLHTTMKSALSSLTSERERLKQCLDHDSYPPTSPQVVNMKNTLAANSDLRERLSKIHAESHIIEPTLINLTAPVQVGSVEEGAVLCSRRSCLPTPSPTNNTVSLWNILRNNIGKDLSKVTMPVHLNEPLNALQRLCEELEYSELLDRAAVTQDPFERMVR
ncbi:hypothetical protein XENOCAPTIV_006710, partial [Xenoophorus captivus]